MIERYTNLRLLHLLYHLWAGKPPQYFISHPGQLSLLPLVRQEMSTIQSAVMLCGWGVKAGMAHSNHTTYTSPPNIRQHALNTSIHSRAKFFAVFDQG